MEYETVEENSIYWVKGERVRHYTFTGRSQEAAKIREMAQRLPGKVKIDSENPDGSITGTFSGDMLHILFGL